MDSVHQTVALREAQEAHTYFKRNLLSSDFWQDGQGQNKEVGPCMIWRIYTYHFYYQEKIQRKKKFIDVPQMRVWMTR